MDQFETKNIFSFIKPLWINISLKRKRQVLITLLLITLNGIMDLISISAILPLLYILTANPEVIMEKPFAKIYIDFFNLNSLSVFLVVFSFK